MLRQLRASGRSLVFISHFLDDILRICDTVTVFRNGRRLHVSDTPALAEDCRTLLSS